jgi:glucokinase
MAMITLGTGVGSGIILNGKVWQGMFGMGGEVGHATVNPEGPPCPCGSRGCLELYASANGLIRIARSIAANGSATEALRELADRPDGFAPVDVAALADRGDRSAQLVFERIGFYLGIGIANLINTLDLPLIAVGGGMASAWHLFCSSMFRTVREFSVVYRLAEPTQHLTLETDRTYLCPAMLGPSAGLMGAGLLPYLELEAAEKNRARSPTENLA